MAVLASLAALPFLYTTISVTGIGAIQSNIEKTELLAPAGGRVIAIKLVDNQRVSKGTTLLTIDATLSNQQKDLIGNHQTQLQQQLNDALTLLRFGENPHLQTPLYLAAWQQYAEALQNASNAKEQAFKIYQRYKILIDKKAVTQAEFEQYHFNYKQAVSDYEMVSKKYKTQWQTEANQYHNELRDLRKQNIQITDQVKQYILKSPVNGSVQNLTGLHAGAFVYANQKLGEISPDSALLAFCFVKPADIGLIKNGQQVRFQIDAFNYNQWGLLNGTVLEIADDITIQNQLPYFKVKCRLANHFLQLKNGYKGVVKKGMTFTARFTIAERSFYQLLYDKVDDWLNPNGA